MNEQQKELIADNLRAFLKHFEPITIESADYGSGFYVFQGDDTTYIQFCYNIHYLNGWLYGAVQAKCPVIRLRKGDENG